MAIGDDAMEVGWDLVPESGEAGRVRWGAREINRTRDMAAEVYHMVPNSKTNFQKAAGIRVSDFHPSNFPDFDSHGNLCFRVYEGRLLVYLYWEGTWYHTTLAN